MRRGSRPARWALGLPVLVAALLVGIVLPASQAAAERRSPGPAAASVEMTMAVHPTAVDTATIVRLMISRAGSSTAQLTAAVTRADTRLVPPGPRAVRDPLASDRLRAGRVIVPTGRGPPGRA